MKKPQNKYSKKNYNIFKIVKKIKIKVNNIWLRIKYKISLKEL